MCTKNDAYCKSKHTYNYDNGIFFLAIKNNMIILMKSLISKGILQFSLSPEICKHR